MAEKPDSLISNDEYASIEEIKAAIMALTRADLLRLRYYASKRVSAYGRFSKGLSAEDLLSEAIMRTLEEDGRKWNKNSVSFLGLLFGTMRSISRNWTDGHIKVEAKSDTSEECEKVSEICFIHREISESELLHETEDGKILNPLDMTSVEDPIDDALDAKQQVDGIRQLFYKDQHVLDILDGWICEMTGLDIQIASGMTKNEYEAAVKRLRRTLGVY